MRPAVPAAHNPTAAHAPTAARTPIPERTPGADDHRDAAGAEDAEVVSALAPMNAHERMRIRAAALHAVRTYPGPVGELVLRELLSWEEFGYRLGSTGLVMRLVDAVLDRAGEATPEVA